jgi:hypothetical protein
MKVYLGFDDTDRRDSPCGTGKLVRWFQNALPGGCGCLGVVRQLLLVCDGIPYTSHNNAARLIGLLPGRDLLEETIRRARAADHIGRHAAPGSDPGLCVATEADASLASLKAFGWRCTREAVPRRC